MPRRAKFPPSVYTRRGRDFMRLRPSPGTVRDVYLGAAGSPESRAEYARIVAELSVGNPSALILPRGTVTVASLCADYIRWAKERYDWRQVGRVKTALKPVVRLYGHTMANDFGPLALETVRAEYVTSGYCRRLCNQMVDCVRLAWKHAAGREQVATSAVDALYKLAHIHKGERVNGIKPPDHERIPSVEDGVVERTLPVLGRIVADMVRLQRLTGARPGEVCALRPCDLERPWRVIEGIEIWLYKLDEHKNDWRGDNRWIPIVPTAQKLLEPYLERELEAYCFSPAEARRAWEEAKRASRKTKVQPSQLDRRKKRPKRSPGCRYTTQSYDRAISKACDRHGIERWSPNQLRHAALEAIETAHSQEDARCVAGHSSPGTTAVYTRGVLRAARVLAGLS